MNVPAAGAGPGGLPAIDQALLPAGVRDGSPGARRAYATALSFESLLVEELSKQLTDSTGQGASTPLDGATDAGADGSGADAATGQYAQLLPGALTDSVMAGGGLGLAAPLASAIDPQELKS